MAVIAYKAVVETESFRPCYGVHVFQGRQVILEMQPMLAELSERCGQAGAMDDLGYFLSWPGVLKKIPTLILISAAALPKTKVVGAVLLHEYQIAKRGIKIFATDDTTGRRTLVAAPALRSTVAMLASRKLLECGAESILISYRHGADTVDSSLGDILRDGSAACRWASREREIMDYLPMEMSLDATLAKMGQRTRNHLRYYRRRAEALLGSVFVPEVEISRPDFLELNCRCAYAVPEDAAGFRYDSLRDFSAPLLVGIRDRDGEWLSMAGGRRHHSQMEIHWQMNRSDLPAYSLSTVMRSYLIDYGISRGKNRLYFEGGTTHSMKNSFEVGKVTDLIVMRRSPFAILMPKLAKRFLHPENMLLQVLMDESLMWRFIGRN